MGVVTLPGGARTFWRPSYIRRLPRWHDGAGRLMDLGSTLDLRLPYTSDSERLAEDWVMVRDDLRRSSSMLKELADSLAVDG